eukprot:TRINITY_DN12057_c6_g5_i1.p1 TRINITY_DN12057_c6_g5~~TRINITY_DN12057_c6_g5_i1.p1  ORF type:complete len:368 (+),score=109.26 TRINITY_DN12057_c6_g5_i1:1032-2135(+)
MLWMQRTIMDVLQVQQEHKRLVSEHVAWKRLTAAQQKVIGSWNDAARNGDEVRLVMQLANTTMKWKFNEQDVKSKKVQNTLALYNAVMEATADAATPPSLTSHKRDSNDTGHGNDDNDDNDDDDDDDDGEDPSADTSALYSLSSVSLTTSPLHSNGGNGKTTGKRSAKTRAGPIATPSTSTSTNHSAQGKASHDNMTLEHVPGAPVPKASKTDNCSVFFQALALINKHPRPDCAKSMLEGKLDTLLDDVVKGRVTMEKYNAFVGLYDQCCDSPLSTWPELWMVLGAAMPCQQSASDFEPWLRLLLQCVDELSQLSDDIRQKVGKLLDKVVKSTPHGRQWREEMYERMQLCCQDQFASKLKWKMLFAQ